MSIELLYQYNKKAAHFHIHGWHYVARYVNYDGSISRWFLVKILAIIMANVLLVVMYYW